MIDITAAQNHFAAHDPVLFAAMTTMLSNNPDFDIPQKLPPELYFQRICRSVVGQQLSVKAAATIWGRFIELCGGIEPIQPELVLQQNIDSLRAAGLSIQKARYILKIAHEVATGEVALDHLDSLPDEAVITELTRLYGIGRWSAEMFLMFTLARPDVFSYGDLGLKMGFIELYGHPVSETIINVWSPHKTIAALTLWHFKDNRP